MTTFADISNEGDLESLKVTLLMQENAALRRSRDEWRQDARELQVYLRRKGVSVTFSQY